MSGIKTGQIIYLIGTNEIDIKNTITDKCFATDNASISINNLFNSLINLMFFVVIIRDIYIAISSMTLNVENGGLYIGKDLPESFWISHFLSVVMGHWKAFLVADNTN